MNRLLALCTVFVAALFALAAASPALAQDAAATCATVTGSSAAWKDPARRYIIFGEQHGTVEAPQVFGDLVCAAARAGRKIAVGLEMSDIRQNLYADYLRSKGTSADREKLFATPDWLPQFQDGRASTAMFALIEKLRLLKAQGLDVAIFTYKPSNAWPGAGYEASMAKNILDAAKAHSDRLIFVLVGNTHGSKSADIAPGRTLPYAPMAAHLPADATLSIKLRSRTDGSSWHCRPATDGTNRSVCGAHPTRLSLPLGPATAPELKLFDKPEYGYDADLAVDAYTASFPMVAGG